MILFVTAFLCGIILVQQFSYLPNYHWPIAITIFSIILKFFSHPKLKYLSSIILAISLGFIWSIYFVHHQTRWKLPDNLEGKPILVQGHITSIPDTSSQKTSFLFSLNQINIETKKIPASGLIHLSWQYPKENFHVGDQWNLTVRLKKIHGLSNPGSFDYEAWSLVQGIQANGYILSGQLLKNNKFQHMINYLRQSIQNNIQKSLPPSPTSPWITALAIGERNNIHPEDWQVLRNTGTNHLMAIAGLHIGCMSLIIYFLVTYFLRKFPKLVLIFPIQFSGTIAVLIFCLTYSALAGFSLPTQRACAMVCISAIILLHRRKYSSWQIWALALLCILLINPLNVLTESFWLSFGSIALIIYTMRGRLKIEGLWWKHGRIQWVIGLGLIPLNIWLFKQFSLISFIANSIAIPWVGFGIVPLVLLGCFMFLFSIKLGGWILLIADKLLQLLWHILNYLSHLSWASWYIAIPNNYILFATLVGMIILLLPAGFPGKYLSAIWLLPLILYKSPLPKTNEVWFTLLDVGQGLSTIIQTKNHVLVFDAGAHLSEEYDMGESVVLPYLRAHNIRKIDMLVVSHGDNDHIGGVESILKQIPVLAIKTSVPERFPLIKEKDYCLSGQHWIWDNVRFDFLYPVPENLHLNNDSSCVLRITYGNGLHHILLTGDIEKLAENYLVEHAKVFLAADILVAPHHGSKTSAVNAFIEAVNPQIVLFPVGYRNRYHFPNNTVLTQYKTKGVITYNSVDAGAIEFKLNSNKNTPQLYRVTSKHYWNALREI